MKPIMRVENDLKPHNVETIKKVLEFYETSNRCCAIQATGTGKTYLILRLLEIFNDEKKKAIILAPNNLIITQTKKKMKQFGLKNAEFLTYSKLSKMSDSELATLDCDLIVADELHRTGAKEWGKSFEYLMESHHNSYVFGVTATPLRCVDGRDMADEFFEGNHACNISLAEALVKKIIPTMPIYVVALYTLEEEYRDMQDKINNSRNTDEEKLALTKELKAVKQQLEKANGVPEIIKKHITDYNGKYIVFCKDKKHLYAMKDTVIKWFREAGYTGKVFEYPYYSMSKEVKKNLEKFENNIEDGLKLLFVIDKLNEGLHLDNIQGCILLRTTTSNIVYYQQIGRVIDAGSEQKRVIIDLVSNFNNLESFNLKDELQKKIIERQKGGFIECDSEFDIGEFYVNDYVQSCVDIFNNIDKKILSDRWTEGEMSILIEKYPSLGMNVDKYIKRDKKSIVAKANKLGLKRIEKYNEEDIELIQKYYPLIGTKCIEYVPHLTIEEIRYISNKYNLIYVKTWSEEDKRQLKYLYENGGIDECFKYFDNRSEGSIRHMISKLKLSNKRDYSDYELAILRKYYPQIGGKCKQYLEERSLSSIHAQARKLGLVGNTGASKYKYVSKKRNKWTVAFRINNKIMSFGTYDNEDEAGKVAMEMAKEYGKVI